MEARLEIDREALGFPMRNIRPLSRSEVRSIDAKAVESFGMPTLILMENAGRGAADWLCERWRASGATPRKVLILCGSGNNGGDGGVVARHLDARGFEVTVIGLGDPSRLKGDAAVQWSILEKSGIEPRALNAIEPLRPFLDQADWVVDALLGTGLDRPLEGLPLEVIQALNRAGKPVVALDLPSGLDCDTGRPLGDAVRAAVTLTFVAPKIGFAQPGAAAYLGEVAVIGIGAPRALLEPFAAAD